MAGVEGAGDLKERTGGICIRECGTDLWHYRGWEPENRDGKG